MTSTYTALGQFNASDWTALQVIPLSQETRGEVYHLAAYPSGQMAASIKRISFTSYTGNMTTGDLSFPCINSGDNGQLEWVLPNTLAPARKLTAHLFRSVYAMYDTTTSKFTAGNCFGNPTGPSDAWSAQMTVDERGHSYHAYGIQGAAQFSIDPSSTIYPALSCGNCYVGTLVKLDQNMLPTQYDSV